MRNATQKRKKQHAFLFALLAVMLLSITVFAVLASAGTEEAQGWNFNDEKYATNPVYMENHITKMPKTFEAYVNMTEKGTSPIISNFIKTNRGCVKFGVDSNGYPQIRLQNFVWVSDTAKYYTLKTEVVFDGDDACVLNKGWTHIAVTYLPGEDGAGTFTLYINGAQIQTKTVAVDQPDLVETIKSSAAFNGQYPDIDVEVLQSDFRELSFGDEGDRKMDSYAYFRGMINSAALYSEILAAEDIALAYENAKNNSKAYTPHASIIAYYDYDMEGNNGTDLIKDQSGNGHDFVVSFYERESEPEDYAYSFAFIGDTQFTVKFEALDPSQNYASSIYDWLVQNKESKKIKYVLGLGDITESHTTPELWPGEWELAVKLHEKLEAAEIPYAIVEGNHDGYAKEPGTINEYFGNNKYFTDTITGYYRDGRIDSYYVNFDVGPHKYMIVALEHCADDDVLAWANDIVSSNPDRRVIVITHALLSYDGEWTTSNKLGGNTDASVNNGIDVWNEFLSLHENIIIAAAGHIDVDPIKRKTAVGVNGNTVETFLINPQTLDEGNHCETGMVAMFYFSDDGSDVQVEYISAYKTLEAQKSNSGAKDVLFCAENQFSFKTQKTLPMSSNTEYGILTPEDSAGKSFALFSDNELVATYSSFAALCEYLTDAVNDNYQILLLGDYDNSTDAASFPILDAEVMLDLGGYNLTVSNKLIDVCGASGSLALIIKNGSITAENTVIGASDASAGSICVTFEGVTFDFAAVENGVTLFDLDNTGVAFDLTVLGGEIVSDVDTLALVTFYTKDEDDNIIFGAHEDAYTKLITHTTAKDYSHYTGSFPTADGESYFVEISDDGTKSVYELQSLIVDGEDVSAAIDITDNARYLSAIDYPFVVANQDGTVLGIYDYIFGNNSGAFDCAEDALSGNSYNTSTGEYKSGEVKAYILMRSDYTLQKVSTSDEACSRISYIKGRVILDMRGYELVADSTRSAYIFNFTIRGGKYLTSLTVKNGSIKSYSSAAYFVYFKANNNADLSAQRVELTFDNMTFGLLEGSALPRFFHVANAQNTAATATKANLDLNLNDVVFDFKTNEPNVSFNVLSTNFGSSKVFINANVKVNGGQILANNLDKLTLTNFVYNAGSTLYFGAGDDGEYLKLILPKNADASKFLINKVTVKTEGGKDVGFVLDTNDEANVYKLCFSTKYGYAPAKYSDSTKYPFLIFGGNGNFVGAGNSFNEKNSATSAISCAIQYLKDNVWDATNKTYGSDALSATVLMMKDYKTSDNEVPGTLYQLQGTLTVDLDGHVLTGANYKRLFATDLLAWSSSGDERLFPTEIVVKNGTIKSYYVGVVFFNAKAEGKEFAYKFEDINFKFEQNTSNRNSSLIEYQANPAASAYPTVEFSNCEFDMTHSAYLSGATLFAIGDAATNVSVTVNGGTIIAGDKIFNMCNETVGEGSLTFGKYNGKYISLTLSDTSAPPSEKFNGGTLSFVKTGESEGVSVYTLASNDLKLFTPKMSLTLDSNLVMNVYIPKEGILKFTFDGKTYDNLDDIADKIVTVDGKEYYKLSVELEASAAARDVILSATVSAGGSSATGKFTFSVIKYADKVLDGNNAIENKLACDVLSYVRAAYAYFGTDDAEAISRIDALLGEGYDENNAPAFDGSATNPSAGLLGAALVLDATPAIRFYISAGADASAYSFYIGDKELIAVEGSDSDGRYLELDVYAYAMCKTITYTVGDVSGSYHINSYYEFAKSQGDASLITLVERFARYCESASEYRDSIVEN